MKKINVLVGAVMLTATAFVSGCSQFMEEEAPKNCHLKSSETDKNAKVYDCQSGPGVIRYDGYYK